METPTTLALVTGTLTPTLLTPNTNITCTTTINS